MLMPVRMASKIKLDLSSGCWIWTSATNHAGYAHYTLAPRRVVRVHRYLYEQYRGAIPKGLVLDHLCNKRNCVNPDHLEAVSQAENIKRGLRPTLIHHCSKLTECKRGHKFNTENTHYSSRGRRCKVCRRKGVRK